MRLGSRRHRPRAADQGRNGEFFGPGIERRKKA
jgi:hypothetical protein